jgi:hypothetical protein
LGQVEVERSDAGGSGQRFETLIRARQVADPDSRLGGGHQLAESAADRMDAGREFPPEP